MLTKIDGGLSRLWISDGLKPNQLLTGHYHKRRSLVSLSCPRGTVSEPLYTVSHVLPVRERVVRSVTVCGTSEPVPEGFGGPRVGHSLSVGLSRLYTPVLNDPL